MRQLTESVGQLRTFRLNNGLEVLLLPQNHAPIVSYQTWFRTGSAHEQPGKTGLAHFFEHLSFKGTSRVPMGQYDRLIEEKGGDAGASTWFDWTEYHIDIPSSGLDLVIDLEADRMQNLLFSQQVIEEEKLVVLSERREVVEDDPIGKANELLWHRALQSHPYAHPTIGWQEDIESYTVDDCRAFYGQHYVPNNAVLVIVGDLDLVATEEKVRAAYEGIAPGAGPQPIEARAFDARREELAVELPVVTPKTLIGFDAPAYQTREHVALSLAATIVGSGASSRFTRALAHEHELLYDFSLDTYPLQLPSLVEATLEGHDEVPIDKAEAFFWKLLGEFIDHGPTQDELTRAKNRLLLARWSSIETNAGLGEEIGFGAAMSGEPDFFLKRTRWLEECTANEVQQACKTFLRQEAACIVRVEVA